MNRRDFNKLSTMLVATAAFPAVALARDEGYLVTTENAFVDNFDSAQENTVVMVDAEGRLAGWRLVGGSWAVRDMGIE